MDSHNIKRAILGELSRGLASYWQLFYAANTVLRDFNSSLLELESSQYIRFDLESKRFGITEQGAEYIQGVSIPVHRDLVCNRCHGRITDTDFIKHLVPEIQSVLDNRPERLEKYDQAFAPPFVVLSRIGYMHMKDDLAGRRVLVLGDDDMLGVCLALTKLPSHVTVMEIDERLIDYGNRLKDQHNLENLEIVHFDAVNPFPSELSNLYDTFFVDPTPTYAVTELFVSRASQALRPGNGVGYLTISHMEASMKKWRRIQGFLIRLGYAMTDIIPRFNTYDLHGPWILESNWRIVREHPVPITVPENYWYQSALVRIEVEGDSLQIPELHFMDGWSSSLYMDDELLG